MKEPKYTRGAYEKKYTNICTHCGKSFPSARPPRNGVSFCAPKHRMAHYRKNKVV